MPEERKRSSSHKKRSRRKKRSRKHKAEAHSKQQKQAQEFKQSQYPQYPIQSLAKPEVAIGHNSGQNASTHWTLYAYKFYFCCGCCSKPSQPPKAIKTFFYSQNLLDLLFNTGTISFLLRPPSPSGGAIGWIVFILLSLMALSTIAGFVVSCQARSELKHLINNGKGSGPTGKTKLALNLMSVALGIICLFFIIFFFFCFYLAFIASKQGNAGLAAAIGGLALILALLMLPFALMWASQLLQCQKMKRALQECGPDELLYS